MCVLNHLLDTYLFIFNILSFLVKMVNIKIEQTENTYGIKTEDVKAETEAVMTGTKTGVVKTEIWNNDFAFDFLGTNLGSCELKSEPNKVDNVNVLISVPSKIWLDLELRVELTRLSERSISLLSSCKSTKRKYHKISKEQLKPKCDLCKKTFTTLRNLKSHRRVHTGERPYTCPHCQKTFARVNTLSRHKRTHTSEKPYQCKLCPKAFKQSICLIKHYRAHTGEKPYECNLCLKRFSRKDYLTHHALTHTWLRPYKCEECGLGFKHSKYLAKHQRTNHAGK